VLDFGSIYNNTFIPAITSGQLQNTLSATAAGGGFFGVGGSRSRSDGVEVAVLVSFHFGGAVDAPLLFIQTGISGE